MQIKKGAVRTPKTLLFSGHGRPCLDSLSAFNDPKCLVSNLGYDNRMILKRANGRRMTFIPANRNFMQIRNEILI